MAGSILSATKRLKQLSTRTSETDPGRAVQEIAAALDGGRKASVVFFFCSPSYDLALLGPALKAAFECPLVGCTSAGQIGADGFQRDGIVAVGLWSDELAVHRLPLVGLAQVREQLPTLRQYLADKLRMRDAQTFGFLLIDGLSLAEEHVAEALYEGFGHMPIAGGSAGDDLAFHQTHIYYDGAFFRDAAVLSVLETTLPIRAVKFQHFEAGAPVLVITGASPAERIVHEINGEPAAKAYADTLGLRVDELTPAVFSANPFVLSIADEPFVRSIQRVNDDGSLAFFCAIESGMVLSIGRAVDPLHAIEASFARVREQLPHLALILGCDCILRRLEFEGSGNASPVGALLAKNHVIGFSTYGEQYNGIHVNQTFTGLALGG